MTRRRPAWGRIVLRLALATSALVVGLLLGELVVRLLFPVPLEAEETSREMRYFRDAGAKSLENFTIDAELGFLPKVGGKLYDEFATIRHDYPAAKRPGFRRILFIGDSVTARGRIVAALQKRYGDTRFEFWNGGVESYALPQIVKLYERHHHRALPDHVILTLHNNDYATTPVAFLDEEGRMVVSTPLKPRRVANRWLLTNSHLYRMFFAARVAKIDRNTLDAAVEVEDGLRRLRDRLAADGVRFTVLLFPMLARRADWNPVWVHNHGHALRVLAELEIRHFDLEVPLRATLATDTELSDPPGDVQHPNERAADAIAGFLVRQELFAP